MPWSAALSFAEYVDRIGPIRLPLQRKCYQISNSIREILGGVHSVIILKRYQVDRSGAMFKKTCTKGSCYRGFYFPGENNPNMCASARAGTLYQSINPIIPAHQTESVYLILPFFVLIRKICLLCSFLMVVKIKYKKRACTIFKYRQKRLFPLCHGHSLLHPFAHCG